MVLIIDPQNAGIAGNMIAGAFVDLGVNEKEMKEVMETATADFGGVKVNIEKINKNGIQSTYLDVETVDGSDLNMINFNESSDSENKHFISYKNFLDNINNINKNENNSDLIDNQVINLSKNVFKRIASSESIIHGKSIEQIHFHEVGAADAVADVFGSVFGYYASGCDEKKVIGLPIALGGGTTSGSHGRIPIPSPATLEILKGVNCFGGPVNTELATPTGAALYMELCDEFKDFQPMIKTQKVAYGAGKKDLDFPNVLRMIQGYSVIDVQKIDVIETNIDHLNGETLGYLFDKLFEIGARDVSIIPTIMKKGRPGQIIKVITKPMDTEKILSTIFEETGTLGIRVYPQTHRGIAKREIISLDIDIQGMKKIRFKIGIMNNKIISSRPEYEDIRKIASTTNLPLNKIIEIANFEIKKHLENDYNNKF
ncbi:hypothetical protein MBCUT_03310 [Methanobrevibacter cuticularis]|uniref:Putative nickel insertion protein n=1 Tax=Methanobrevibacter cuticularis TaxID=47311 RepID=A0A166F3R3_9EURY|nr:nickel pincer cofactor biosynthesis protein LarC [Methanobrevibacter cuticularis]KZX17284.1 hypothetical protein MBCUT_03310 [Methanobrevibacter cuticularis]